MKQSDGQKNIGWLKLSGSFQGGVFLISNSIPYERRTKRQREMDELLESGISKQAPRCFVKNGGFTNGKI